MNIEKRNYRFYRYEYCQYDFYYNEHSDEFWMTELMNIENDDGSIDHYENTYPLDETNSLLKDKVLAKEIKNFKAYVNKQLKKVS